MRILVTGASGFLGQHFLHALLQKRKNDIFCIYRSECFQEAVRKDPAYEVSSSTVNFKRLDLTNKSDIDAFFDGEEPFDICFHIAAISSPRVCQQDPKNARAANVPTYFFDKLKDTPIIALSTDQVYCGTKAPYMDDSVPAPLNTYAETKLDMERYLLSDNNRSRPAICLRSSIILGPLAPFADAHSTFLHFCKSRENQETTFYTDEVRSVININDVKRVLLHFCDSVLTNDIEKGVYNMGGPERVSRMKMASAVADHCGFAHKNIFVPAIKAAQPIGVNHVPSPLDISMSSSKLEELVGSKFQNLESTIKEVFPK